MKSDSNSDITIYTTISQFNNSDIETPDEFADSEPSPSTHTPTSSTTFSKPPFQPIQSHSQHKSPYTPSQVTPTYSPFKNERSTNPTLMQPLKKFSPESIRAIARKPNIDLESIGIYSKYDIQHHIRTQQFQELLTQMETIQRQSIDQNLQKLAETAGFSDIYAQDYSGYFKDIKDYIYLNGEKYRPQDISPINIFSFVNLKNEVLAFLGWPYYNLERLTILYTMFNFIGFLFSLLKGIYNTCAIHIQVIRQANAYYLQDFLEYFHHQ